MLKKFVFLVVLFMFNQHFEAQNYYFYKNDSVSVVSGTPLRYAWAGGINSAQFSKIDLNNDGVEDLFVFDRTGHKILTFIYNTTLEEYEYAPQYESKFPKLEHWAVLRDYNCDGKKDIFSYVFGGVGIWKNTSTASEISFEYISSPYVYTLRPSMPNPIQSNLFVSKVDLPDIRDIDGDGDLDILTFSIIGETLEYHRNMSVEYGFGCDSIKFELRNDCWGHFLETGTGTNECILFDTCNSFISAPHIGKPADDGTLFFTEEMASLLRNPRHSGSTCTSLDLNGDNVKDVLLGDVSFNNIVALFNDNKGVNMNTSMVSQDTDFPSNSIAASLHTFPAAFVEDIDNDGILDLVVSPNIDMQSEDALSAWYYKNYGTNSVPEFQFIKKNLLQDNMIDVGTQSYPSLVDFDGDGLLDLVIGNFGYFDPNSSSNYQAKIALYKNIGTSNNPIFNSISDNYLNLSSLGFTTGAFPTFADIDNDGDLDMILGDYDGKLHLFKNSSNSSSVLNLSLTNPQLIDDNGVVIDVGYSAKPILFDLNGNGAYDLVVGEENGNLNYYENVGGVANPMFRLQSVNWGGVDVSEWWTTIGNSAPCLFRNSDNEIQLFVGSEKGAIFHYNGINGNLVGNFNLVDTLVGRINIGPNAIPTVGYLNNDTLIDLIVGTKRGGVGLFYGSSDISLNTSALPKFNSTFELYPNPATTHLLIKNFEHKNAAYSIIDNWGREVQKGILHTNNIDISELSSGFYIFKIESQQSSLNSKFIKK